jgi:hypothetical protein
MTKDRIEFNEAYAEWWIRSGDTGELLATCDTYKEACRLAKLYKKAIKESER